MSLNNTIKALQDIMRKDAGVDGDAQRIGQLAWLLFLKIYSDLELKQNSTTAPTSHQHPRNSDGNRGLTKKHSAKTHSLVTHSSTSSTTNSSPNSKNSTSPPIKDKHANVAHSSSASSTTPTTT